MTILKYAALLCTLLTLGCSATPVTHQGALGHPAAGATPLRVEGAHGPLSVQQTKEILARFKKSGPETSIFTRHLALEEEIARKPVADRQQSDAVDRRPRHVQVDVRGNREREEKHQYGNV